MRTSEHIREEIEAERRKLDRMLESMSMEDVLGQSRKLDSLIEEYMSLTN